MPSTRTRVGGTGNKASLLSYQAQDGTSAEISQTFRGDYDDIVATMKALWHQYPRVSLVPRDGGLAELTVTQRQDGLTSGAGSPLTPSVPPVVRVELTWEDYERPLEEFPEWADLTAQQVSELKTLAQNGPNSVPGLVLTPEMESLLERFQKGRFTYTAARPVVTRTTSYYSGAMADSAVYFRDDPPNGSGGTLTVTGFTFLKTADTRVAQGKTFSRVEQWKGYEELDPIIYPEPPPPEP